MCGGGQQLVHRTTAEQGARGKHMNERQRWRANMHSITLRNMHASQFMNAPTGHTKTCASGTSITTHLVVQCRWQTYASPIHSPITKEFKAVESVAAEATFTLAPPFSFSAAPCCAAGSAMTYGVTAPHTPRPPNQLRAPAPLSTLFPHAVAAHSENGDITGTHARAREALVEPRRRPVILPPSGAKMRCITGTYLSNERSK